MGWKRVKDGVSINDYLKQGLVPSLKRLSVSLWTKRNGKWDAPHAWTDLFNEPAKISIYHHAHVMMILVSVLILTLIGVVVL